MMWTEHPLVDRDSRYRALSDGEFAELAGAAGEEAAVAYVRAREERIAQAERDPFRHEFRLPNWDDVEAMVQRKLVTFVPGGNNPGKSWWAGSLVMRFLTRQFTWEGLPAGKLKVLLIAQDDLSSEMFQQPAVYSHFPREWRVTNESGKKPPGFAKCINYGDKNGFTEGNFVLPKPLRGQCWFKTVAQYTREPKSFEGPSFHLVIIDEGAPVALFKSLLGRVSKVAGRVVYLLTCLHGYDQTMGQGLDGARIVRSLPMQWDWGMNGGAGGVNEAFAFPEIRLHEHQTDLLKRLGCPAGHLPYVMQPLNPHWGVIFMWNTFNPFQPPGRWRAESNRGLAQWWRAPVMPAMMDACVGQPRWKSLVMLFGWTERLGQLALGNFNPEVHVMRGERREALDRMVREGKGTVWFADDPETQRSHACLWLAVFADGLHYLFDESPRIQEGEWVNANGERGEGQYVYGKLGANWYKRYLREREREWNVGEVNRERWRSAPLPAGDATLERLMERRGDPRGFATEESTATGTRNMYELYLEDHSKEHGDCYPMLFTAAKIRRTTMLDLDNIITLLAYDEDRATREGGLSVENRPRLVVSERCENFIRCACNYTLTDLGKSNEDDPWRDFIDAVRYLFAMHTPHVDMDRGPADRGGGWG